MNLAEYKQPSLGWYFESPLVEWDTEGITIHFYKEIDLTNLISEEEKAFFDDPELDPELQDLKNLELEQRLRASTDYLEVKCSLGPSVGIFGGCYGWAPGTNYRIAPGGEFRKI